MKLSKVFLIGMSAFLLCSCGSSGESSKAASSSSTPAVSSSSEAPKAVEFDLPAKFMSGLTGNFYGNYIYSFDSTTKTLTADCYDSFASYPDTKSSRSFSQKLTYVYQEGAGFKNNTYATVTFNTHEFKFTLATTGDQCFLNGSQLVEYDKTAFKKALQCKGNTYISEQKVPIRNSADKYVKLVFGATQSLYTSTDKTNWEAVYTLEGISNISSGGLSDTKTGVTIHTFDLENETVKLLKSETTDYPMEFTTTALLKKAS